MVVFVELAELLENALNAKPAYEVKQFEEIQVIIWNSYWESVWSYCRIEPVILLDFDWLAFGPKAEKAIIQPDYIGNANLLTCRQLLTLFLKNDSLGHGQLAKLFDDGLVETLLKRIVALTS